jgi:protein-arginine kinase activator protein McsA
MEDTGTGTGKKKKAKQEVVVEDQGTASNEDLKTLTLEELDTLLGEVLESEDYIRAIAIRDEINNRKKNR